MTFAPALSSGRRLPTRRLTAALLCASLTGTGLATLGGAPAAAAPNEGGTLVAWNPETGAEVELPEALRDGVVDVDATTEFAIAAKSDGSVVAWDLAFGLHPVPVPGTVPADVVDVATDGLNMLALTASGEVVSWRRHDTSLRSVPSELSTGVEAISLGGEHHAPESTALALKEDRVLSWDLWHSELGGVPAAAESDVVTIASGGFVSLAVKKDGSVVSWDSWDSWHMGPAVQPRPVPAEVSSGVTAIAAWLGDNLAVRDGGVVSWSFGSDVTRPVPDEATSGVSSVSIAGGRHLALKGGRVLSWSNGATLSPVPARVQQDVTAVVASGWLALALVGKPAPVIPPTTTTPVKPATPQATTVTPRLTTPKLNKVRRPTTTLTRPDGAPMSGRKIVFRANGKVLCTTRTDKRGVATCRTKVTKRAAKTLTATFKGTNRFTLVRS